MGRYPEDARLLYVAGEANRRVGNYDRAVSHLQALVGRVPDSADGHFRLGPAFAHRAPAAAVGSPAMVIKPDLDSAVAHCGAAVSLEPGNPVFHYNLGRALHLKDEFAAAAEAYRRAVDLGLRAADVQRQLGKALERAGDSVGARAALRAAAAADATDAESRYLLAKILDREGRTAERHEALFQELGSGERPGVRALELRVQRQPADVGSRRALASACAEAGKYERAQEELRIAAALDSNHLVTHLDPGLLLERDD